MRVPEAEPLMLGLEQCQAYNRFASGHVHLHEYVYTYRNLIKIDTGTVIDLGSGSCNFVIALAESMPNLNFVCYEGSPTMITIARENIEKANLSDRITLIQDDIFNASGKYDIVLANRLLHHINDADKFWKLVNSLGDNLLVVDIDRPPKSLVDHIQNFDHYKEAVYKNDLISSMRAAYSLEEVMDQVEQYGYTVTSDHRYRLFVYHTR